MFADSPMTAAEEAVEIAFEALAAEQRHFAHLYATPGADPAALRKQIHRSIEAEKQFKAAFAALIAPTPPDLEQEAARLGAEGTALFIAVMAFVGLFLPDLRARFWSLAITFTTIAALGGWSVHYLGRLGQHIGRRM